MPDFVVPENELRERALADGITHLSTGVAAVRDGKILVVRREINDFLGGNFELPGGGIEPNETISESVQREVLEETGLVVQRILGMFPGFEYETPTKPRVRQFNFLVEVNTDEVVLSDEHDQSQWISVEDLPALNMTTNMKDCLTRAFIVSARSMER